MSIGILLEGLLLSKDFSQIHSSVRSLSYQSTREKSKPQLGLFFFIARARAFLVPLSTTNFLALVMPV